jgi:hypothetical protein
MDQALLVTVAVFVSGFIVGYLVRHIISRRRRAKLKRRRRFFYEGPLATDDSCIENLSERAKIASPIETVSKNTRKALSANPDTVPGIVHSSSPQPALDSRRRSRRENQLAPRHGHGAQLID